MILGYLDHSYPPMFGNVPTAEQLKIGLLTQVAEQIANNCS